MRKFWFRFSLLLNVLLSALLVARLAGSRPPGPAHPGHPSPPKSAGLLPQIFATARAPDSPPSRHWLHKLREAGVPESVLAQVIVADYERRREERRRDLRFQYEDGIIDVDAFGRFEAQHDLELEEELRSVLGADGFRCWDKASLLREFAHARFELSPDEADFVYGLKRGLIDKQREFAAARRDGGLDEAEFNDHQVALEQHYRDQLKAALGDERFAEFQNPGGGPEASFRRDLSKVEATGEQVTAMLEAQRQWTGHRARLDQNDSSPQDAETYEARLRAMEAARDREYERILGARVFAEFQKAGDPRYQILKRSAASLNLNDSDVDALYAILRSHRQSSADYQQRALQSEGEGQPVDWPAVQQNLFDFTRQTEELLRQRLGRELFLKLTRKNALDLGN